MLSNATFASLAICLMLAPIPVTDCDLLNPETKLFPRLKDSMKNLSFAPAPINSIPPATFQGFSSTLPSTVSCKAPISGIAKV